MSTFIPQGWHTVTLRLVARDPLKLIQFLKDAFAATGEYLEDRPTVVTIGDTMIMVSGVVTVISVAREPMPAFLYLYVGGTDETFRRAIDAGATVLEPPQDMPYGDRRAMVKDPFGNVWQIATHLGPVR